MHETTRHVFYFTDEITDADLASFRPLVGPYASGARGMYWMGTTIDSADASTFRVLNAAFACSADQVHAYYRQTVIVAADPKTFPLHRALTRCDKDVDLVRAVGAGHRT